MLVDQLFNEVFNTVTHTKTIFVRKNGKLKKVTKPVNYTREPKDTIIKNKPLFPISKDRSKGILNDKSKED